MNSGEAENLASRAVARAALLCPKCMAAMEPCEGAADPQAGPRWASAEEMAAAAKAYADFISANLHTELQAIRKAASLSVYELARRTGLDRQTLGPIDSGSTKPTPHTTARIAFVLHGGLAGWGLHFDALLRSRREKRQP
jgi:DNA-binding XRE family transcriptional regulator